MPAPILEVENLSKRFLIARQAGTPAKYRAIRDELSSFFHRVGRRLTGQTVPPPPSSEELWALRDINFSLAAGQALAIIGRNGAGKSTLLKLLSRITEPTLGRITLRGRMASLLEVGTGFHRELTGRENIYLNGVILGMTRREVARKLDEIVDFAEIERFIDTPVKRYSSGMYMRLAFAVAAHLEPDILVVDEVLAVGDATFQRKCLGKMQDVTGAGRTVLFVSHNLPAVQRLCTQALYLVGGRMAGFGEVAQISAEYLKSQAEAGTRSEWSPGQAPGTEEVKLTAVRVLLDGQPAPHVIDVERPFEIELELLISAAEVPFRSVISFHTQGVCAFMSLEPHEQRSAGPGRYLSRLKIPANLLTEGEYSCTVAVTCSKGIKHYYVRTGDVVSFMVADQMTGASARGDWAEGMPGIVRPMLTWEQTRPE